MPISFIFNVIHEKYTIKQESKILLDHSACGCKSVFNFPEDSVNVSWLLF